MATCESGFKSLNMSEQGLREPECVGAGQDMRISVRVRVRVCGAEVNENIKYSTWERKKSNMKRVPSS